MAGFRTFATGEVLTAANVNDFLMKQSVMVFADATARTAALGAEVVEGMLTFNKDTGALEVFDGTDFVGVGGGGGFDDVEVITATNATFSVPALASPIVKVTVIGGGGGGGGSYRDTLANPGDGATGGSTTFGVGAAFETVAEGGTGGRRGGGNADLGSPAQSGREVSANGGAGATVREAGNSESGQPGFGGRIVRNYIDLESVSTVDVVIGAGGGGGGGAGPGGLSGGTGGPGVVIFEYKAA